MLDEFKPLILIVEDIENNILDSEESEDFKKGMQHACNLFKVNMSVTFLEQLADEVLKEESNYGEDF